MPSLMARFMRTPTTKSPAEGTAITDSDSHLQADVTEGESLQHNENAGTPGPSDGITVAGENWDIDATTANGDRPSADDLRVSSPPCDKAMRKHLYELSICGILYYIDSGRCHKHAQPNDVARGVAEMFVTYYWDSKSRMHREIKPHDYGRIRVKMGNIVKTHCDQSYGAQPSKSEFRLVKCGSGPVNKKYLRQICYGTHLPPLRSTIQDYDSSAKVIELAGTEPASYAQSRGQTVMRSQPGLQSDETEIDPQISRNMTLAAPIARDSHQSRKNGSIPPEQLQIASPEQQSGIYWKRKIPRALPSENKRSRMPDSGREDGDTQPTCDVSQLSVTKASYFVSQSPSASTIFPDSTDFRLDEDDLKIQLLSLYQAVRSLVDMQILPHQGVRLNQSATFALFQKSDPDLDRLYELILGRGIVGDVRRQVQAVMSASELTVALIGVFISSTVFTHPGIETADRWLEAGANMVGWRLPTYEEYVHSFGTNFDTIWRHTYFRSVRLPGFQNDVLGPIAHKLADELSFRLYDHLVAHEREGTTTLQSREDAAVTWSQHLATLLKRALTLRCEMSSAREKYSLLRYEPGAKYDCRLMESTRGPGDEVLVSVFPGISVIRDSTEQPVCEAQVRLK